MPYMSDTRLTEKTAAALGQKILNGGWQEGEKLPSDTTLCAEYGISRTVLRESLRILSAKGLITAKPRQGTHINAEAHWALWDASVLSWLDEASVRRFLPHACHMRLIIEPGIAALAASNADDAAKTRLQAALRDLQTNPALQEEKTLITALYQASANPFGISMQPLAIFTLHPSLAHTLAHTPAPAPAPAMPIRADYAALTAAISQGDATASRQIATRNLITLCEAF